MPHCSSPWLRDCTISIDRCDLSSLTRIRKPEVPERGTKIRAVSPDSPASAAGLDSGDEILEINGHPAPDALAVTFHLAEERARLRVRKADGRVIFTDVALGEGGSFGADFEDFRTRTCNNDCIFCFIHQLPPGVRRSLKVKDDDYRLSFLHGNYITLTNLADADLERIIEHKLSPLYVSVHTTDPDLRTRILGRQMVDDLDRKMSRLTEGGIRRRGVVEANGSDVVTLTYDIQNGFRPGLDDHTGQ